MDENEMDQFDDREHYRILNPKTKARMNYNLVEQTSSETELMKTVFEEKSILYI